MEIFAFVPASPAAPGICDREFMPGLSAELNPPGADVLVGGVHVHTCMY